ncbi:tyrosine-type recombinase/integrase [Tsukamurella tyrosinosolvens]|uniref:tyrosine-type recombinase/integrase n=1 Tax=Tsukamurella tyrosinosolvens TaxID=57704 RepID=UPI0007B1D3EA|nr:site-specific integrase [Tsukamurella tyrosinosolvens]KZL97722.1 integrase [Tsukamurella tyrosinosolvens]RDB46833.1 site-specific integrase [Tsukamurella tyrosinosolvens]
MPQARNRRAGVEDRWRKADGTPSAKAGKGSRWRARYVDAAGGEHEKLFARKVDAQKWLDGQTAAIVGGTHVAPRDAALTFHEWAEQWLAGYAVNRKSTLRQAKSHVKRIEETFGDTPIRDIRPSSVKTWVAALQREGMAASTVHAYHSRLRRILDDAVHDGYLPRNPCSKRTAPPMGKSKVYVATTEQVWAVADAVPAHYRAAVLLGAFAGLRVSEAVAVRTHEDVDFIRGIVHPREQWTADDPRSPLKTEGSEAPVPIPNELALELAASVKRWPGETLVTDGATGARVGPWRIEAAIRNARGTVEGLPETFVFHDLRHYFASALIAGGADIKTVQARLRHAKASTTLDVYGHLFPDADESTRAVIAGIFKARADSLRTAAGQLRATDQE